MRILVLPRYDRDAASTRFRFEQFVPALRAAGIDLELAPLLPNAHVANIAAGRRSSPWLIAQAYARRVKSLIAGPRPDLVWIYCELFPYLPAFTELLVRAARAPIVFDYDDAIFHVYDRHPSAVVRRFLGRKLEPLLREVAGVTCGNDYLADYASRFCDRVLVVPTVVDTDRWRPAGRCAAGPPVIGWIGSPSSWVNVEPLLPVIENICCERGAIFRAMGAGPAADAVRFDGFESLPWSEAAEIDVMQTFDIGIMPLLDRPFQRGKSGFKLIQYMACGLPCVASPVGVNAGIVTPDTGILATTHDEWAEALLRLLNEPEERRRLGAGGREAAVAGYSVASQAPRLITLFRSLVRDGTG